jgi:hypothetical protein
MTIHIGFDDTDIAGALIGAGGLVRMGNLLSRRASHRGVARVGMKF